MRSHQAKITLTTLNALFFVGSLFISIESRGQQSMHLEDVLMQAQQSSIFNFQAKADNKIAHSRFEFFRTNLRPGIQLEFLAPNFVKTSREIIQPDGSIAFQSVSQNNSSINLNLSQQIQATGGRIFVSSQLQRFDDFSLDRKQYNGIPIRIGFFQPLFGFNQLKWDSKIEPLFVQEADRKFVIDMETIHLRGTSIFFDLLLAQIEEDIAQSNTDVNETLLKIAQERFDLGKISKNELLQLQLEYKNAVRNLSAARFQVAFATGALSTFLGGIALEGVSLIPPDILSQQMIIDFETAVIQARLNRPELVSFERQQKEADRDIRRAEVDFGIQANISASFGLARGAQILADIYTNPITEQQVQLSVSVPLVDWGRKKAAVGIAKANKDLIHHQITQAQLDFENEVLQSIASWHQLQREIALQDDIRIVSLERFDISRQRYVLGDISITDLTIAQREKDQAQRDYIATLREYWVNYYQIRRLTAYDFSTNTAIHYSLY